MSHRNRQKNHIRGTVKTVADCIIKSINDGFMSLDEFKKVYKIVLCKLSKQ